MPTKGSFFIIEAKNNSSLSLEDGLISTNRCKGALSRNITGDKSMNFEIDNKSQKIIFKDDSSPPIPLYSEEGFKIISDLWLKIGWDQKYIYSFTWLGRPIIQLPSDMVRIQELIYAVKPDVVIETGVAHGGGLILYSSVLKCIGKGKVIGIDIDIRPHNRKSIEEHELSNMISLIEGDSISKVVIDNVKERIEPDNIVLVILDSCHTFEHVLKELEMYSPLVTKDSYIIATDGSQKYLGDTPRARTEYSGYVDEWGDNNPQRAALEFAEKSNEFKVVEPKHIFQEGFINFQVTHWPSAYLKRI